jgi:tetratricopeptide (TPR) repeat protein
VVRRRLEQLSDHCLKTLTMAAVYGREFSLEVIEALSDSDAERVLDDLEEATDARIIAEAPGSDLAYLFTHDLVREAVYEQVTTVRRKRMHAHIASVLERLYQGQEIEHHLAELARHFVAAERAGDPDKAIDYSVRAGGRALEQLAYEEAARNFEAAITIVERRSPVDELELCQLLQDLGEARRRSGQFALSLEPLRRAFGVARNVGASDRMAAAAIAFEMLTWSLRKTDANSVLLCKEALAALSADRNSLRAKLTAAHARALHGLGTAEEAAKLAREAVELARQVREPSTLCYVLELVLHMTSGPAHIGKRLSYSMEYLEYARAAGDFEKITFAIGRRIYALLEAGDVAGVDEGLKEHELLVPQLRQPQYSYFATGLRAMRACLGGRFADAEQLALETLTWGQRLQLESAEGVFGMQMFTLRREQGRLHEVAPIVEMFVQERSSSSSWKPGLALMYSELGLTDKARALFDELAANEFTAIPQDDMWAAAITFLVEVCTSLGDIDRADVLYRLLSPYAGFAVVAEVSCFGAASRYLGQLAATMGRSQEAESHFDQALAMNARMGAKPWLAHTQFQYARMLIARSAPTDVERAMILLDGARTIARQLGMRSLETRVSDVSRKATESVDRTDEWLPT